MSEREAVLFANEAFYRAFADREMAAMEEVWAAEAPVACIHPGWQPLEGREAVLESWRAILSNANSPPIVCRAPRVHMRGEMAFVVCYEDIGGQFLVATNVFVREGRTWRIVHHQAGPTAGQPEAGEDGDGARTVN